MSESPTFRIILIIASVLSLFFFPYPATILLSFVASLSVPLVGLVIGILADALYLTPGSSIPFLATLIGAAISVAGFFVRRFIKARIIGG